MTEQQRALLDRLFSEAVALPREQQQSFLEQNCNDREVWDEIGSLLAFETGPFRPGFLDAIGETAASLAGSALIGQRLGSYRLTGRIGQGGMGTVYRAVRVDDEFQQTVAIKILRFAQDDTGDVQRFRRERQILATLEHSHVARLLDGGAWLPPGGSESQPYIVMEYVEGVPLTTYCEEKQLNLRQRLLLFRQVCDALSYAHQRLVVHRDIKPANILVTADGTPKLLDFGIAKLLDLETGSGTGTRTSTGQLAMTPDYASPEQVRGEPISTVTDVYSLGAVLYELLTGCRPHQLVNYDPLEIAWKICECELRPPSVAGGSHLRGDLDVIVLRAMQKDPARRYRSVEQFSEDIRRYLEGLPVIAQPDTLGYRAVKFVQRHRLGLVGVGAVFLALVGGVAASTWQAMRARRAEQAAVVEKQRADAESATAKAVNDFLQNDLLAQAGASAQAGPNTKPDPDMKVRTALDRAAARIAGKFGGQPLVEAAIRLTIGKTYLDLGLYPQGRLHMERALELRRRALGEEHPVTLNTASNLGELYWREANYAESEQLLARILDVQRRVLGKEDPGTLQTMESLGIVYDHRGKYAEAEALDTEVLRVRRRDLSEEHPDVLTSTNNLAVVYKNQRKYVQAATLLTRVLEVQRRALGEEHPDTLITMGNLGGVYLIDGQYSMAEPLLKKAVEVKRRILGAEHPESLSAMNNLGTLYIHVGKYVEAEPLFVRLLEVRRRVSGDEHPGVLTTMNNLGMLHMYEGKYAQAELLLTKVLEVERRVLGKEHSGTLSAMNNLAILYRAKGEFALAEALITKILAVQGRLLGEEDSSTLDTMRNRAVLYRAERDYARAEALLTKILEVRRRVFGEAHRDTTAILAALGEVRIQLRKYAEAEPLLRAAGSGYEKARSDNWRRYSSQSALGASLVGQRKYLEAEPLLLTGYQGILERETTIPAENRSDLEQARKWIVRLYQDWGKPDKLVEWRETFHSGQVAGTVQKQ